jgi:hypothetical protein
LAFPPDVSALEQMREVRLARCGELERRARLAWFVSVAFFMTWVADVAAVFEHDSGVLPAAFGVASLALAVAIVAAHGLGRLLYGRAQRLRRVTERSFTAVRLDEAEELLALAARDAAVAQYLRMVGRQRRALRWIEHVALVRWPQRVPDPYIAGSQSRRATGPDLASAAGVFRAAFLGGFAWAVLLFVIFAG